MVQGLFEDEHHDPYETETAPGEKDEPFVLASYTPESKGETIRRTGLAWSAGIAFVGAIVFMLFLGWFADLLLGSSPWGLVGGIILGSIIGFLQFFRITSQIFKTQDSAPQEHPLMSPATPRDNETRLDEQGDNIG